VDPDSWQTGIAANDVLPAAMGKGLSEAWCELSRHNVAVHRRDTHTALSKSWSLGMWLHVAWYSRSYETLVQYPHGVTSKKIIIHDKIWRLQVLRSDAVLQKMEIEVICVCSGRLQSRSNRSCLMQAITQRDRWWYSSFVSSITLDNVQFIAHCSVRKKCNVTCCELKHRSVKRRNC